MSADGFSLRDYDESRYGPYLGVSDEGSAASEIAKAARASPKAQALPAPTPLQLGIVHDAERLGSIGEAPVGPGHFAAIHAGAGEPLLSTNVGSHVASWHYLQPPSLEVSPGRGPEEIVAWARERGDGLWERDPRPWLRLRFQAEVGPDARLAAVRAASGIAPVAVAVRAEEGVEAAAAAIELAAAGGAEAVVVEGLTQEPLADRAALPGLLNYFDSSEAGELLARASQRSVAIEPALKADAESVANQVWAGLSAARAQGCHLGKYGLLPLTPRDAATVVERVERWFPDWTTAPAVYLDVPVADGERVYDGGDALTAAQRWLEVVRAAGASVVLVDTVEKSRGMRLVKSGPNDGRGILSWDEVGQLQASGEELGLKILWAGGISLSQLWEFGRRRPFGVYVTSAVSDALLPRPDERDIGLLAVKEPDREKVRLARALLDAGFLGDNSLASDARAAAGGDRPAAERLERGLVARWRQRLE